MDNDDLILISDFLAGELSDSERAAVERRLNQDEAFAALHAQQVEQIRLLQAIDRAAVKEKLKAQYATYRGGRVRSMRLWTVGSAVAAAVIAFFLFRFLIGTEAEILTPRQQARAYLQPYSLVNERGEDSLASDVELAYEIYRAGDYDAAISLLEPLLLKMPDDDTIRLCLAESYSQVGMYADAIFHLEHLPENSPFQDAVQWRLALNKLLGGEKDEAKILLTQIAGMDHYRAAQADTLLNVIDQGE
ncbi:MAG: tetratricopeptide repeat protein [Bacteroidota bacterium]